MRGFTPIIQPTENAKNRQPAACDGVNAESCGSKPPISAVEPYKPFPVDAMPVPLRGFVNVGAKAIGCDASFIALPLLAAAASAIGNTRRIQLKRSWSEPAIVWCAIVGDSGTLKSPAIELALRAVRERQRKAMRDHTGEMDTFRDDLMRYERDLAGWKKSKDISDPPAKPEQPIADRIWTDDATTEALAVLLANQWRGLLMVRDELAGWLGGFDRYSMGKGGDVPKWLEMFGGRPMIVDRKTSGTIYVPAAAVSIIGGIQPATLRRALGIEHLENGLAARLLLTWPLHRPKQWTEADMDASMEEAISDVLDRLYAVEPEYDIEGDPRSVLVPMTHSGKAAWIEFYNAHAQEQADLSGELSAVWSKLEGYAARLALVVHFVRWAADDPTLDTACAVDEASIAAGVTLSRWFGNEAKRVYAMLSESDEARESRRLVDLIRYKGGSVTPRDLMRSSRQYPTAEDAEAALHDLESAGFGWIESAQAGPKGGRPSKRFRLYDIADVDNTPTGDGVTGSIVNVNTVNGD